MNEKIEAKVNEKKVEVEASKTDEKKVEEKKESAVDKPKKKPDVKKIIKKEEAVAIGKNLHMSKKHAMYICKFIKNKEIDSAIFDLGEVIKMKRAVPFKGEIPHRKGKGMMSGRYPTKASGLIITILKGLKGNSLSNGLELEKTRIYYASASWGVRPARSKGRHAKRTNIVLKAKEVKYK